MSRTARIVIPGVAHHVAQWGNNKENVFFVEDDKHVYLELLQEQSERFDFQVLGYCLMPNHTHIVGIPENEESLTKAVGRTHFLYTQYINRLRNRSGHFWQNRFFSCPLDEHHMVKAIGYIELNPARLGMVAVPWTYRWSSAAAHCGQVFATDLLNLRVWREIMTGAMWRETLLELSNNDRAFDAIRRNTRTGRPLGSDSFIRDLEEKMGRRLRPLPVGRQKGWRKNRAEATQGD